MPSLLPTDPRLCFTVHLGDHEYGSGSGSGSVHHCQDMDTPESEDSRSGGCMQYMEDPLSCGLYDDEDFTANELCCACGGGEHNQGDTDDDDGDGDEGEILLSASHSKSSPSTSHHS